MIPFQLDIVLYIMYVYWCGIYVLQHVYFHMYFHKSTLCNQSCVDLYLVK